jgi:putative phage-type endonuclease
MGASLLMRQDEINASQMKWRGIRGATIGASDVAVLLGIGPQSHGSPYSLWVEKRTGVRPGEDDNTEMQRGRVLEPYVASEFARMRDDLVLIDGGMYASAEHPWMTATFDRLAVSRAGAGELLPLFHTALVADPGRDDLHKAMEPVEIKTAYLRSEWGEPGTDQVPVQYRAQAQWQMAVWGPWTKRVLIPVQFMDPWETAVYVVARDEADIAFMIKEARSFLDLVLTGTPPPIDWTPQTAVALRAYQPMAPETSYTAPAGMARRYVAALIASRKAERRLGKIQNELVARSGGAQRVVIDDPEHPGKDASLFSRSEYPETRVDIKLLRERYPLEAKACERVKDISKIVPNHRRWNRA